MLDPRTDFQPVSLTPRLDPVPPPGAVVELGRLNPWALPGLIRNRPIVPIELKGDDRAFGLYNGVRWEPSLPTQVHPDYGQGGGSLMAQLAEALELGVAPSGWEWAVNKTILGVGDSLMRNNVHCFTRHISPGKIQRRILPLLAPNGKAWQDGQAMGTVDIPELGLKVAHWFHQGMIEQEMPSFYPEENQPQNFEAKFEQVLLPTLDHPEGLDGRTPDLIIFESLSWDLVFLVYLSGDNGDQRFRGRPLDDKELDWLKGRHIQVLQLLRKTFPTSKIVVQTAHLGAKSPDHWLAPVRAFQQARCVEAVALETGLELFDWGRIVSPLSNEMIDGLHYSIGVATWLWGEMALSYLRRAYFHPVDTPRTPAPRGERLTQQDLADSYAGPGLIQYTEPGISTG